MAASHGNGSQRHRSGRERSLWLVAVWIPVICGGAITPQAAAADWTVLLEPMHMDAYGHDQHVLTVHEVDLDSMTDTSTPVTLDTEARLGYRLEFQYDTTDDWGLGLDFFWFSASQGRESRTAAADSTGGEQVIFEIADRAVTSSGRVKFSSSGSSRHRDLDRRPLGPAVYRVRGLKTVSICSSVCAVRTSMTASTAPCRSRGPADRSSPGRRDSDHRVPHQLALPGQQARLSRPRRQYVGLVGFARTAGRHSDPRW